MSTLKFVIVSLLMNGSSIGAGIILLVSAFVAAPTAYTLLSLVFISVNGAYDIPLLPEYQNIFLTDAMKLNNSLIIGTVLFIILITLILVAICLFMLHNHLKLIMDRLLYDESKGKPDKPLDEDAMLLQEKIDIDHIRRTTWQRLPNFVFYRMRDSREDPLRSQKKPKTFKL